MLPLILKCLYFEQRSVFNLPGRFYNSCPLLQISFYFRTFSLQLQKCTIPFHFFGLNCQTPRAVLGTPNEFEHQRPRGVGCSQRLERRLSWNCIVHNHYRFHLVILASIRHWQSDVIPWHWVKTAFLRLLDSHMICFYVFKRSSILPRLTLLICGIEIL